MQSTITVLTELSRRSLDELGQSERSAVEIVERLPLSQPTVSKHLRLLWEADRVASRVDELQHCNRVRQERLAEIDAWPAPCHRFWAEELGALQAYLDQEQA